MNRPVFVLIATLLLMAAGLSAIVADPQSVVGKLQPSEGYPQGVFGAAQQGSDVYVRAGCVECHTQQVRGVDSDLALYGPRRTVARDYIGLEQPLLGNSRIGPDLSNVGIRYKGRESDLYKILLSPDGYFGGSMMPSHRFLFDRIQEEDAAPDVDLELARDLAEVVGLEKGELYVPTAEADSLVSYLASLKRDAALTEAPTRASTDTDSGESAE